MPGGDDYFGVYSTYFYKPREGKLTLGPVWDFDRTMGCDHDRRARNPYGWSRNAFRFWYRELFDDARFRARYRERWRELRRGAFSDASIARTIDAMAAPLAAAAERDTARWGAWTGLGIGGWPREVAELERWIAERLAWYDAAVAEMR